MKCWDFKSCPDDVRDQCPAYPDNGLDCWTVFGTKCEGGLYERVSVKDKMNYCYTCDYYLFFGRYNAYRLH